MNRFFTVLAFAAVAGVMYVAAASGSHQVAAPTAKEFKALQRQVTSLSTQLAALKKDEGVVKSLALGEASLLTDCMAVAIPVNQFGDGTNQTEGYRYAQSNNGGDILTTALDVTASDDPGAAWFTGGTSKCGTDVNGSALRHLDALAGVHPAAAGSLPVFHAGRH
ncbi:MAG TPA: hypothetical protein VKR79_12375 [Gaiellaceae bacterium]|nr:hypothetical protein [Gaiellaceae bacterium]